MNPCLPAPAAVARAAAAAFALTAALGPADALAADPFADAVVLFDQGLDGNTSYADPTTALGSPERFTGEQFPEFAQVVSLFSPPFGTDEIVSVGRGGVLVLSFDEPVTDDPLNPFGIDVIVFGNTGFTDDFPATETIRGVFGADGGAIEVSADGVQWVTVPGVPADGLFPTVGYLDAGGYDTDEGVVPTDFTRPVDPSLALEDFLLLDNVAALALYDGAGGGAGVDLAGTGLSSIRFVRITNPVEATTDIEVDAVSDVAPRVPGDASGDGRVDFADVLVVLGAWGGCPPPHLPCPGDLDGNGTVDFSDILVVLSGWTG